MPLIATAACNSSFGRKLPYAGAASASYGVDPNTMATDLVIMFIQTGVVAYLSHAIYTSIFTIQFISEQLFARIWCSSVL